LEPWPIRAVLMWPRTSNRNEFRTLRNLARTAY